MNKFLITLPAIYSCLFGWESKVNDNISNKLSLFPLIVENSSGSGPEAWILWTDNREQSYEVYCNGLNSNGSRYWNGDAVISKYPGAPHNGHRLSPVACKGNNGDVYVAFVNHHNNPSQNPIYKRGIYLQRIKPDSTFWEDDDGNPQSCSITTASKNPPAIAPCQGGAIISWLDTSGDTTIIDTIVKNGDTVIDTTTRTLYRIMVEKRYSDGNRAWTDTVRSDTAGAKEPKVVPNIKADGNQDGVWVVWQDIRWGAIKPGDWKLYARRVNNNGVRGNEVLVWRPTSSNYDFSINFSVAPDDSGGIFITLRHESWDRSGEKCWLTNSWIRAQRVFSNENIWSVGQGGKIIRSITYADSTDPEDRGILPPRIAKSWRYSYLGGPSGSNLPGGVNPLDQTHLPATIITWSERDYSYLDWELKAVKLDGGGSILWNKWVSSESGNQISVDVIPDGERGALFCWRQGDGSSANIWANRLSSNGNPSWSSNPKGVQVCGDGGFQGSPRLTLSDSQHSIITWDSGDGWNIYAKDININTGQ